MSTIERSARMRLLSPLWKAALDQATFHERTANASRAPVRS